MDEIGESPCGKNLEDELRLESLTLKCIKDIKDKIS